MPPHKNIGRNIMQYKVTIEKTDVKHFEFDVDVDMEKVKSWVH